jgi:hypothetical protein
VKKTSKYVTSAITCLMTCTTVAASRAGQHNPINLLAEFRPIGGIGNNPANAKLNAIPEVRR